MCDQAKDSEKDSVMAKGWATATDSEMALVKAKDAD